MQEEKRMMDNMVRSLLAPTTPSESTPRESTPRESTPRESTPSEPTPSEPTPSEPTPSEQAPATPVQEEKETAQSAEEFFASGPPEKSE